MIVSFTLKWLRFTVQYTVHIVRVSITSLVASQSEHGQRLLSLVTQVPSSSSEECVWSREHGMMCDSLCGCVPVWMHVTMCTLTPLMDC